MPAHIFGIRHHGPGSARSLMSALQAWRPDAILIEGPPDADELLPWVIHTDMRPPVAILVYDPKNLTRASFFPFAEFSPEWQAICYGLKNDVATRFMDLPMSFSFALQDQRETTPEFAFQEINADTGARGVRDPFGEIAALAGYTDPERWWEAAIERSNASLDIFPALIEMMQALRSAKNAPETRETLLREAYMRQSIRQAEKEGKERIAVVCGAWHAPVLAAYRYIKAGDDAALLKGLKKVKTAAVWAPWSFDRLAMQSGYAAGVVAPAWYRTLFQSLAEGANPAAQWMAQTARLLREADIDASAAHVIEATRLADNLAALRMTALPGIEELRESAIAVLCDGAESPLALIDRKAVIGDAIGAVPDAVAHTPLKADFEAQAKSCRLERSVEVKTLELDLREDAQLKKSRFLHRLRLLGVSWGVVQETPAGKHGAFHELWSLKWNPDFEIQLIEAGIWGSTVAEAAVQKTAQAIRDTPSLSALTLLLGDLLKADLPALLSVLTPRLRNAAAMAQDAIALADAMAPLVEVWRYGAARRLDTADIEQILEQIVPRLCVHLPSACLGLDEQAAAEVLRVTTRANRAFGLLQREDYAARWQETLSDMARLPGASPLLAGFAARLLFDARRLGPSLAAVEMSFRLSPGQPAADAAAWLEGFLQGSGLLLLYHRELWTIIDDWVGGLPDELFQRALPVLRRSFSRFPGPEREKMLDMAKSAAGAAPHPAAVSSTLAAWDAQRAAQVSPLLRAILG